MAKRRKKVNNQLVLSRSLMVIMVSNLFFWFVLFLITNISDLKIAGFALVPGLELTQVDYGKILQLIAVYFVPLYVFGVGLSQLRLFQDAHLIIRFDTKKQLECIFQARYLMVSFLYAAAITLYMAATFYLGTFQGDGLEFQGIRELMVGANPRQVLLETILVVFLQVLVNTIVFFRLSEYINETYVFIGFLLLAFFARTLPYGDFWFPLKGFFNTLALKSHGMLSSFIGFSLVLILINAYKLRRSMV